MKAARGAADCLESAGALAAIKPPAMWTPAAGRGTTARLQRQAVETALASPMMVPAVANSDLTRRRSDGAYARRGGGGAGIRVPRVTTTYALLYLVWPRYECALH